MSKLYICKMGRRKTPLIFENIEIIDAGARGKTVAKAPDGRVIFLTNTVPGDVVDIRTGKQRKAYFEGTAIKFHKYSAKELNLFVIILKIVVVVSGNLWLMNIN